MMEAEPKPGTQERLILDTLRSAGVQGITQLDCATKLRPPVFTLAERVRELRLKGWRIENVQQPKKSGGTCGRYVLAEFLEGAR